MTPAKVDGKQSVQCYLHAMERCYHQLCEKHEAVCGTRMRLAAFDFCVFHAPFNKMARKAAARLLCLDRLWCVPCSPGSVGGLV